MTKEDQSVLMKVFQTVKNHLLCVFFTDALQFIFISIFGQYLYNIDAVPVFFKQC